MELYSKFRSLSKWVQLSIISSFLQILFICSLEGTLTNLTYKYIEILDAKISSEHLKEVKFDKVKFKALPCYMGLFFLAQFFQFILCVDAALYQNTIQVSMLAIFNFMLLFYACTQLFQTKTAIVGLEKYISNKELSDSLVNLEISIIVILILFASSFAFIAYKLYQEYGWNLYKRIGADLQLKKMFMVYHVFVMILKFDILFFVSFSTQYIVLVIIPKSPPYTYFYIHLAVSLAICIVLSTLAFWSVRAESRIGIGLFTVGCLGVLGYFIHKMLDIYTGDREKKREKYESSQIILTIFIILCMIFAMLTIIGSVFCYRNFDRGLKDIINNKHHGKLLPDERAVSRNNSRWSLE